MKKKIKLFATIATLCLSLAIFTFGVFSALTVTYKTTGTISYDIEDTYVEIETRIYSTSKKYDDEATLKAKSQEFETSTFTTLDALTTTGLVEGETTHDFNKVQIKNLDQGEDYTVQESDYKDTYSSVTATEAPEDLEVALKYQTAQGEDKGVYTYFVVTKLTNKSALPLYAYVPEDGEDKYVAPENSNMYKLESEYKEISGLNSEAYIVFAMSLNDITVAIDASSFVFPIAVTKDLNSVGGDYETIVGNQTHITQIDITQLPSKTTYRDIGTTTTVLPITVQNFASQFDFSLVNFQIDNADTTQDLQLQLSLSMEYQGETGNITNILETPTCVKGNYFDFTSVMENVSTQSITITATKAEDETCYTIVIPKDNFSTGELDFCLALSYSMIISSQLQTMGIETIDCNVSTNQTNLKQVSEELQYDYSVQDYALVNESLNVNSVIESNTYTEDSTTYSGVYSFENYQVKNINLETHKLSLNFECTDASKIIILDGINTSVAITDIMLAEQFGDCVDIVELTNGTGVCVIPSEFEKNQALDLCIIVFYGEDQSFVGQTSNLTITINYREILDSLAVRNNPTFDLETYNLSSTPTTISVKQEFGYKTIANAAAYNLINISASSDITSDIVITLSATTLFNGETINAVPYLSIYNDNLYKGNFKHSSLLVNDTDSKTKLTGVTVVKNDNDSPSMLTITIPASNFASGEREFVINATASYKDGEVGEMMDYSISTTATGLSVNVYTPKYEDKYSTRIGSSIQTCEVGFESIYYLDNYYITSVLNFTLTDIPENKQGVKVVLESEVFASIFDAYSFPFLIPGLVGYSLLASGWLGSSFVESEKEGNTISFRMPISDAQDGKFDFSIVIMGTAAMSETELEQAGGIEGLGLANVTATVSCEYCEFETVEYELRTDENGNEYYAVVKLNQTSLQELEIASNINGIDVTTIDALAFNYAKISVLTIPSTITKIEAKAFGEDFGACDIGHLIVHCDPTVLPYVMADVDWDFYRAEIKELTLTAYTNRLPGFIYTEDPFIYEGYNTTIINVPSGKVSTAQAEFEEYLESYYIEEEDTYEEAYYYINQNVTFKAIS